MSYDDRRWNNDGYADFRGPHNFPGRPPFRGQIGNMHPPIPSNRPLGLPSHQQSQSYSKIPETPFAQGVNSSYFPRQLQHAELLNRPPPPAPAPPPRPPTPFSNPMPFQGFPVPPPNNITPVPGHPLPALHNANQQNTLSGVDFKHRPPPVQVQGSSFQQIPIRPPYPQVHPCGFPPNHYQPSPVSYNTGDYGDVGPKSHGRELSDKEIGAQKLEKWLQRVGKLKRLHLKDLPKAKSPEQLWESLDHLKTVARLITDMSVALEEMKSAASSATTAAWDTMTKRVSELKVKFGHLESVLDETSVLDIEKKLSKVRHRKARLRRSRISKFEEEQRLRESWEEKGQQIDKWQERHRAKIKEENLRKSRKAAADRTLSKVTREIQDASRLIETMLALQKLRLIRRDAAQKRGDTDLGESRQAFEEKIADMTRLVQSQLECYKEEEAKLKQVIKSEQDQNTEKERQLQIEKEKQKQREEDEELWAMLFGPKEEITESSPLFPYTQYYKQAENSLQAFIQIRHEWDSFLVSENTPTSSVIPSSWVFPEPPSSAVWASALK